MGDEQRTPTPEELIQTKDRLLEHWRTLPSEHQATMLLVFFQEVMSRDMAGWTVNALFSLYFQNLERGESVVPAVTRAHLKELSITNEELASLTDDDLAKISRRIQTHYTQDLFWDELAFHTEQVLREKHSTPSENNT